MTAVFADSFPWHHCLYTCFPFLHGFYLPQSYPEIKRGNGTGKKQHSGKTHLNFSSIQQHVWHPHLKSKCYLAKNILDTFPKISTKNTHESSPFSFYFYPQTNIKILTAINYTKYFWPSLLPMTYTLQNAPCLSSLFTHAIYAICLCHPDAHVIIASIHGRRSGSRADQPREGAFGFEE